MKKSLKKRKKPQLKINRMYRLNNRMDKINNKMDKTSNKKIKSKTNSNNREKK